MTNQTTRAREDARTPTTGRFGLQAHTDPGVVETPMCHHGQTGFCYDELTPVEQHAFDGLHQHAYDWAVSSDEDLDAAEQYAAWYALKYYPDAINDAGEIDYDTPTHTWTLFDQGVAEQLGAPKPRKDGTRRPHLDELNTALASYDRHGSYGSYVGELVRALGYTQNNGFATKELVSPTGAKFPFTGAGFVNKTAPEDTMAMLGRRLQRGAKTKAEKAYEQFLGEDASWFMVERKKNNAA